MVDAAIAQIRAQLRIAVTVPADRVAMFFKTGVGDYAHGDQFMGVPVPVVRRIAKEYKSLSHTDIIILLTSCINEERLLALLIMVDQYQNADVQEQEVLYQLYMQYLNRVNNWNLVDSSAHLILGAHVWDKDRTLLFTLAHSPNMWYRRIAIIATWYFIRRNDFACTFDIAYALIDMHEREDLLHKAVGWMLREVGKRDQQALINFLDEHVNNMPRTMVRYAIEKFPEELRRKYLLRR